MRGRTARGKIQTFRLGINRKFIGTGKKARRTTASTALITRCTAREAVSCTKIYSRLAELKGQIPPRTVFVLGAVDPDSLNDELVSAARRFGEVVLSGEIELWNGGFAGAPASLLSTRDLDWEMRWGTTNHWNTGISQLLGGRVTRTCLRWQAPGALLDATPAAAFDQRGRLILSDPGGLRAAPAGSSPAEGSVTWIDIDSPDDIERLERAIGAIEAAGMTVVSPSDIAKAIDDLHLLPGDRPDALVPPRLGTAAVRLAARRTGRVTRERTRALLLAARQGSDAPDETESGDEPLAPNPTDRLYDGTFAGDYTIEEGHIAVTLVGGRLAQMWIDGRAATPRRRAPGYTARPAPSLPLPVQPRRISYLETAWAHWFADDESRGTTEHAGSQPDEQPSVHLDTGVEVVAGFDAALVSHDLIVESIEPDAELHLYELLLAEGERAPHIELIREDGTRVAHAPREGVSILPGIAVEIETTTGPLRITALGETGPIAAPFAFTLTSGTSGVALLFSPLYAVEQHVMTVGKPTVARITWAIGHPEALARTAWPREVTRRLSGWTIRSADVATR